MSADSKVVTEVIVPSTPPFSAVSAPTTTQEETKPVVKDIPPSSHLLYAVEMLAFSSIGWAWLAVRELMGATPVMDVSVLLSLLVASAINLILALVYYTAEQFKSAARAFFNLVACIVVLYSFSLNETTTDGRTALCCTVDGAQKNTFSLRLTYKAVYFGGLSLHQPAAAITLSFLLIFLILAAAQAKACMQNPVEWPLPKAALALICLLSLHQAMFALSAPVCKDQDLASGVAAMAGLSLFVMIDISWLYEARFGDEESTSSGVKKVHLVRIVQLGLEFMLSLLVGLIAAVIAVNLGSGDSLLLSIGVLLVWQALEVVGLVREIRGEGEEVETIEEEDIIPAATQVPAAAQMTASFRQPFRHMLLPGIREVRRELRRAQPAKKAW